MTNKNNDNYHYNLDEDEDEDEDTKLENEVVKFDKIENIRIKMVKYCNDLGLPLCQNLTLENMIDFIKHIS